MANRKGAKRVQQKLETAAELGSAGAAVGGLAGGLIGGVGAVPGAAVGGGAGILSGLLLGDTRAGTIVPFDMVAVSTWDYAALLAGSGHNPNFVVVLKEGEVIGLPQASEAQESQQATGMPIMGVGGGEAAVEDMPRERRKPSAYNRRYARAFKQVSGKYRNKNGKWRKGGFRAASKAAHHIAGGKS